jgi:hypothetical protein
MVGHLLQKTNVSNSKSPISNLSVMVSGGYHTSEMAQLLRKKNISFIVVSPKVTKIDLASNTHYLSVFDREKTPLEQLFSGQKLFLVSTPAGSAAAPGATAGAMGLTSVALQAASNNLSVVPSATQEGLNAVGVPAAQVSLGRNGDTTSVTVGLARAGSVRADVKPVENRKNLKQKTLFGFARKPISSRQFGSRLVEIFSFSDQWSSLWAPFKPARSVAVSVNAGFRRGFAGIETLGLLAASGAGLISAAPYYPTILAKIKDYSELSPIVIGLILVGLLLAIFMHNDQGGIGNIAGTGTTGETSQPQKISVEEALKTSGGQILLASSKEEIAKLSELETKQPAWFAGNIAAELKKDLLLAQVGGETKIQQGVTYETFSSDDRHGILVRFADGTWVLYKAWKVNNEYTLVTAHCPQKSATSRNRMLSCQGNVSDF